MTQRWRCRTIALGSGDASRIICSSLIAQAFDAVRYPILPKITPVESGTARCEIAEIRHSSFYAPRDFDISPYFMVVKPTLARGFPANASAEHPSAYLLYDGTLAECILKFMSMAATVKYRVRYLT